MALVVVAAVGADGPGGCPSGQSCEQVAAWLVTTLPCGEEMRPGQGVASM